MKTSRTVVVHLNALTLPVYEAIGEGTPHVDTFTDLEGYEWRTWANDKTKILPLIQQPLTVYEKNLSSREKSKLKNAIQYILNIDEDVQYETWSVFPELRQKKSAVGERLFATYQDTIAPYDWYVFCELMWEILYGDQDWHTDISMWQVSA